MKGVIMGRVIWTIYISFLVLALIGIFSNDQEVVKSASNVLKTYDLFKVCVVTLLFAILTKLEKNNRTKI
jgi:hypothetical protein